MGSQASPLVTKLRRESSTIRTNPHRRTSSVSSSCVSLESGDQDALYSPARISSAELRKPPAASSPRTPAGVILGEKSAMKKRRSSIGGADDLVRALDFSTTSSSPGSEEKKLHAFLTKGGGHKKVVQAATVSGQANSPGKKTGSTPPGKEKLVVGRAISASILSPSKSSDGRELSKKDISSARKSDSASEGLSMNGMLSATSDNPDQVATKKSSPLRLSSDSGKVGIKTSSPCRSSKSKSELVFTRGRTNSNGEFAAAMDLAAEADTKTDYKFSPGISQDGKTGRKSSPRPSLRSKPGMTSPTGRKVTKTRQDTPSPQPDRVRRRNERVPSPRREDLLARPEMESVEVSVYADYEHEREADQAENMVESSHEMPVPLQRGEAEDERLTLLASLMDDGNVADEDMSSLEQVVEPGFGTETELLPTSWLSEDLPCMFSSLSHLPEPDDSRGTNLLGDPPEVLDEPVQVSSSSNIPAVPDGVVAAEVPVADPSSRSPFLETEHGNLVAADGKTDASNVVFQFVKDESAWIYELNVVDSSGDKFGAELRTQIGATNELQAPQLSVPQVEDPEDKFEAELRTQIDTAFESPEQLLVPPARMVPVAVTKDLLPTFGNGEAIFGAHSDQDISSSTSDNESFVPKAVENEACVRSSTSLVTEPTLKSGEGQTQPISSQNGKDQAEVRLVVPTVMEGDKESLRLDLPEQMSMSVLDIRPPLSRVEDETSPSQDQSGAGSSDDEVLEDVLEDSGGAQLNLKQSFEDVAESLAVSRTRVDEIYIKHANIVSALSDSPQELVLSTEPEFGAEFLEGEVSGVFSPTYLDQDMKIFEEYWMQSVANKFLQSDAGQNDAKDLQPSIMSNSQVEDEAANALPPVELPVSTLPSVGKLKLTVVESIASEPPVKVNATKVEIVEETLPREGWPCPVSLPASGNHQVDIESASQVEEFDEVFHLFKGSEGSSSSSRPNVSPYLSESGPKRTTFVNGYDSRARFLRYTASNLGTEHAQAVQELQDTDVKGVADISTTIFAVQDASIDPYHASNFGAAESPVNSGPTSHDALGRPSIVAVSGNELTGQYLDDDDAPDDHSSIGYLHQLGGSDKPIQVGSGKGSFETTATSETQTDVYTCNEVFGLGPVNPSMAHKFCASSEKTGGGSDRNGDDEETWLVSGDCFDNSQRSIGSDFCGLNVKVASEIDNTHKISPTLPIVEGNHLRMLVSSPKAGVAENEVKLSDSNAQLLSVGGAIDGTRAEADFLPSLDKEEGGAIHGAIYNEDRHVGTASTLDTWHKKSIPGLEMRMKFENQGLFSSVDGSGTIKGFSDRRSNGKPLLNSIETEGNFQTMVSSDSAEVKVELPGQEYSQEHGDDEFQQGERDITTELQIIADSHREVNMSAVDYKPQILQLTLPQRSITLKDCPTDVGDAGYITIVAIDGKSQPTHDLSATCIPEFNKKDDIIPDKLDADSEVNSTASPDMVIPATEAAIDNSESTLTITNILGKGEATHVVVTPLVLSTKGLPNAARNEIGEFDRHEIKCEVNRENSMAGDYSKLETVDFGVQGKAEQAWEGSLLTVDSSCSKSSKEGSISGRSAVAYASRDIPEDLEIDQDKSEEAWSNISTSGSTPSELIEHLDCNTQEIQLPLEMQILSNDQVPAAEDDPEIEQALMTLADAHSNEYLPEAGPIDSHAPRDVEITPGSAESRCTKDLPSQDTQNAHVTKEDLNLSWKGDSDKERLIGTPQQNRLPKDVDMVVDSAEKSFVHSEHDKPVAPLVDVDEVEEGSSSSLEIERENVYLNGSWLRKAPMFEAEEAIMAFSSNASGSDVTKLNSANVIKNQSNSTWTADKDEENLHGNVLNESLGEEEEIVVHSPKDTLNTTTFGANDIQNHSTDLGKADGNDDYYYRILDENTFLKEDELDSLIRSLEEEESFLKDGDSVVYRPMESLVKSDQDLPGTSLSVDDKVERYLKSSEKANEEGMKNAAATEEAVPEVDFAMPNVEDAVVDYRENPLVVQMHTNAASLIVDAAEKQAAWRHEKKEEESSSAENLRVFDLGKPRTWRTSEGGKTLIESQEEMSNFDVEEADVVDDRKESFVSLDGDNARATISDMEKHSTWTTEKKGESVNRYLEEESVLEVQEKVIIDSSTGKLKSMPVCQGPEVKPIIVNGTSDSMAGDLVCPSKTKDNAKKILLEVDEKVVTQVSKDVNNAQAVNTDHLDDQSFDYGQLSRVAEVADCKSCVIPEMTNGNHLYEFNSTAVLAEKAGATDNPPKVDSLEEATEPHSPEASALYPLLASQPPFSGSQQDRLWEEQAEAYSSGGRGTPARNEDAPQAAPAPAPAPAPGAGPIHPTSTSSSSSPSDQLAESSSDDLIQLASAAPTNNTHYIEQAPPNAGSVGDNGSALHEPKGKGKLHTPLRSLLLEDASKVEDGDPSAPNGVTSSPSFIKRLFRVMSTPSRSAERDASQTKQHKKSLSMWVSCLGSPQVQQ